MTVKSLNSCGLVHCKALLAEFWLKFCECENIYPRISLYVSSCFDCTARVILRNSHILLFGGFWPFQSTVLIFSSSLHDCSRQRIAAPSFCVLSLFIGCDLRHDSLWAYSCFLIGKKEVFVTRELSVLLLMTTTGAAWVAFRIAELHE